MREEFKTIFETLIEQCKAGTLILQPMRHRRNQEVIPVVCSVTKDQQTSEIELIPLAKLFTENPYDELVSPFEPPDQVN